MFVLLLCVLHTPPGCKIIWVSVHGHNIIIVKHDTIVRILPF